jgi:hypothetical protein
MAQVGFAIAPDHDAGATAEGDLDLLQGTYLAEDGSQMTVSVQDGQLQLAIPIDNWALVAAMKRAGGAMVDGGGTVDAMLPVVIEGLASGASTGIQARTPPEIVDQWRSIFAGTSPLGTIQSINQLGYYFTDVGVISQFAFVNFESGTKLVHFQWHSGLLSNVELEPDPLIRLPFERVGGRVFRRGRSNSWRATIIEVTSDRELRFNGSPTVYRRTDAEVLDDPREIDP